VMSSDSAVTYTFVHSKARSWSIPSEDPYEEAARQLLEQAPHPSEYVPDPMELEDHVPVYIPEPEHPEDLVPAEDEAPIEPYITEVASAPTPPLPPPSLLPTLIRPPHTRAAMAQRRATAPSIYHSLLPAGTPPLLPIPLPAPSTSRRADIPEADTPPRKRLLLTAPTPRVEVGESSAAAVRQPGSTMARMVNHSFVDTVDTREREFGVLFTTSGGPDRAAVRAEIEILRRERLAYKQESIETRQALDRPEAYSRALETRIRVLETQAYRHEWQRPNADDRAIEHIIRTQALEAGARVDTLEDTSSRSGVDVDTAYPRFPLWSLAPECVVSYVTPPSWKQHLKEISLDKLCDIHDTVYMRQVVLDNVMNGRTRELMSTLLEVRAACDAIWERETGKDKAYAEPKAKLVLEEKKWVNYDQTLGILYSKDKSAVVVKVVPHVAKELVCSDEMGLVVARLVKTASVHGRCSTFEEAASLKEPFKLEKMPGYGPFSKIEFDQASDNVATASYPFLTEATTNLYASSEVLLSKRPMSLHSKSAPSQLKSKPSSLKVLNLDS
ncbi:hypothetical protein Tco_0548765, partial [Tanacetum coccineum]